ncbi:MULTISPECIES: TRAP transporter substrate-binding protein [Halomonadaceae]|mgnify:CR=1 FL=1|uniref:TRAP transporter substrate-binding protein n=2 Tax=Vreelandella TaxID=3137766 RepID=A0A7Z0S015_9GAMM|nr:MULTISPECIES: TRAP transporter substrate-binding protein [Halomonas]NYS79951.1 TRAP transporter substrate-binding protein [Halomonas glaciei]|tara:strand:- start:1115 stop:2224 length:1110 start_codon:yes stop_codon:yes gene_type:complete
MHHDTTLKFFLCSFLTKHAEKFNDDNAVVRNFNDKRGKIMLKRKLYSCVLALGLVAPMHVALAQTDQTTLRLAVETTPGDPLNVMLATFRDALQESAEDSIELEFFEGGALGDEAALMQLIRAGEVQVVPLGSDVVELDNNFALFDMPFLFADKESARATLDGELGDLLSASLRDKANLEVLAYGELGFRVISNNRHPIRTPKDLDGLKLRTPGSETRLLAFEMLGAAPTPMALGEVYVALRQGVLDGQENPLSVLEEFSLYEVQDYVSLTNHVYTPITLAMNASAYDSLSAELQEKMAQAAQEGAEATRQLSDESDATLVDDFTEAGVSVNQPDLDSFISASVPIRDEIAKRLSGDFWSQAQTLLEQK